MLTLLQSPIACGAAFSLLACTFWIVRASASKLFSCTFRHRSFCLRFLSFFDAHAWRPGEPISAQGPPPPPQLPPIPQEEGDDEEVTPAVAHDAVDPNDLPSDVWLMCLKGLDLASLVKLETAVARTLPANLSSAFSDAWDVQEARVDPDERVEGATARDRAIGSCPAHRRQLMRQFVETLWMTGPAGDNETVLDVQALVSGDYDVYVAFSRPASGGCCRTLLAGDFVDRDDVDVHVHGDGVGSLAHFDFSSFDLTNWPSLQCFSFIQRFNDERGVLVDDIVEALGEVEVTVAAIHRTALTPSVLFTSDNDNAMNGFASFYDTSGAIPFFTLYPRCRRCRDYYCRAESMDTSACDGEERTRHIHFLVSGFEDVTPSNFLAIGLTTTRSHRRCWRPWWLTRVLLSLVLCLVCIYNMTFWLDYDLHATSVEFF